MKIKLLNNAKPPKKQRPGDCGWDLYLNEDVTMPPHETTVVDTNICLEIPSGYWYYRSFAFNRKGIYYYRLQDKLSNS